MLLALKVALYVMVGYYKSTATLKSGTIDAESDSGETQRALKREHREHSREHSEIALRTHISWTC